MSPGANVAVLSRRWGTNDEAGWALRQVAGALACVADVHVVTPQGRQPMVRTSGALTVHELGCAPDSRLEARRDVLIEAISRTRALGAGAPIASDLGLGKAATSGGRAVDVLGKLVSRGLAESWEPATTVLRALNPDLVVVGDYREVSALGAIDRAVPNTPLMVVPLGSNSEAISLAAFTPLFDRSRSTVVFTESEALASRAQCDTNAVHNVGLPLSVNSSVLREPPAQLGDADYIFVITGAPESSSDPASALARLLRARFSDHNLALAGTDTFVVSMSGVANRAPGVERGSDLLRLIAWARATVDLRPGRLFARRSLESLLYSTPIVVPSESRAREHAERGGGLWFDGPADLLYCVEAMFDHEIGASLGDRGKSYAESVYGSPDRFVDNVVLVAGLEAVS